MAKPTKPIQLVPFEGPDQLIEAFGISRETSEQLKTYAGLLETWQRSMNLVAPKSIGELWHRHMADSAQIERLAPRGGHWVDFGAGAGFPGLVVAILRAGASPDAVSAAQKVTLVESDAKKCAFLAEVVRRTGIARLIPVEILTARIEAPTTRSRLGQVQTVSARAVAPLLDLLGLSAPLFGPETVGLFLKGRGADQEIAAARSRWAFEVQLHPSVTDREGAIVEIRSLSPRTEG